MFKTRSAPQIKCLISEHQPPRRKPPLNRPPDMQSTATAVPILTKLRRHIKAGTPSRKIAAGDMVKHGGKSKKVVAVNGPKLKVNDGDGDEDVDASACEPMAMVKR